MSAFPLYDGLGGMPGMSAALETVENQVWSGRLEQLDPVTVRIDGTARDAGNTDNTTKLRPGLLMGTIAATQELAQWNPNATDGTSRISHVICVMMAMQQNGANVDRFYWALKAGPLRVEGLQIASLVNPGIVGTPLEYLAAKQLRDLGFTLNRPYPTRSQTRAYTADATVTIAESEQLITNLGATGNVTITLPAPVRGAVFRAANVAGNNLVLAAGTNNIAGTSANVTLAPAGDTVELLGVATAIGSPDTIRWVVIGGNGFALS